MQTHSIKFSKYIEYTKPEYSYIHVIPHKGIRNYSSKNMAKTIAYTYQQIEKKIRREKRKLFFEADFKISYIIDISKDEVSFYFLVPSHLIKSISTKILETWEKATLEILDNGIKPFSNASDVYQLSYKKEDALSLEVDTRNTEPLSSILGVLDIMKEDDRIGICYNFMPSPQAGWSEKYQDTITRLKNNKNVDKAEFTMDNIFRAFIGFTFGTLDLIIGVITEFLSGEKVKENNNLYDLLMGSAHDRKELSSLTKKKKESTILQTQIAVISSSHSPERQKENALSVCQSYNVIDGDNELKYKKISSKEFDMEKRNLGIKSCSFSTEEIANFIQVPGRSLLNAHKINHVKTNETIVPEALQHGTKLIGTVTYKGKSTKAYIEDEYNNGNLPLCYIGSQGSGKTTMFKNYARYCNAAGESVFVIDFIKDCELSDSIASAVPKEDLIILDLATQENIQGFGFNEIEITDDLSDFEKLNLANLQATQTMALVDSMNSDSPLTPRMRRILNAAANVVFVQKENSLKSVIQCLDDHQKRAIYIRNLSLAQRESLEDEIKELQSLDEYSKPTKEMPSEVIGTISSKIDHVLDRVALLREDFKLKFMYNKKLDDNINFVECMDKGKTVLIKMRESEFPSKMQKNVLVTYFISKLWLASQLRGAKTKKPLRCNTIIDEPFQAPTCMENLNYILPQSRKFGLKILLSMQYSLQLKPIFDSLVASGSSFQLLTGCTEDDFNRFKNKFPNFDYEDLRDMAKFHALCLIKYGEGYASFIAKLPAPPRAEDC